MTKTSGQLEVERLRERKMITIEDRSVCYYCNSTGLTEANKFCPNCGFPQGGEQFEMERFMRSMHDKKKLLEKQQKAIKTGRNVLYILAALNFVIAIALGLIADTNWAIFIGCMLLGGLYTALGKWSNNQPFAAILSGLIVFIMVHVISAVVDPSTIYKGLLIKGAVIVAFIYGFKGVKDAKKLEAELETARMAKSFGTAE